jgi:SnoaL-like domain
MKPLRMPWLAGCVLSCAASACALGPEPDYRPMPPAPAISQELAQRTRELYADLSGGRSEQASLLYSQEPGRIFVGLTGNDFRTASDPRGVALDEYFVEPGSSIVPGELIAYADREAGWVVDRPTVKLVNGTELHIRLTLLWRNEYGIWKIVHSHASLAR